MEIKLYPIKRSRWAHRMYLIIEAITYRTSRPVTEIVQYPTFGYCYPLCPRCKRNIEREYIDFCDRCGQKLNWKYIDHARIKKAPINKPD